MSKWIKVAAIIVISVLADIVLHLATSAYSTMPQNPSYSIVARLLGTEITVSLWALLAFSGAACAFVRARPVIPGEGTKKGLRYGSAIAMLWLFAMMEGVALFGNPMIKELIVGLSDAVPVFVMGVLLSLVRAGEEESAAPEPFSLGRKMTVISSFTGIFLAGRYSAYFAGVIQSGYQTSPLGTFIWTLLMGACIGGVVILLGNNGNTLSLTHRTAEFSLAVFGVNWAAFLMFMPLLFAGYLTDALSRIIIDTLLVAIGYYLIFGRRIESNVYHRA